MFLGIESILYIQYIDTVVEAQAYKIFRQKKSDNSTRYVASELAAEFLSLYRTYRFAKTKQLFDDTYIAILIRAIRDEDSDNENETNDNTTNETAEAAQDDEVDDIVRPIAINKRASCNYQRDILIRQLKINQIIRYLERYQQVYKEKYVKAQTDKIRYFGYDMSLVGKGIYTGLKKQTASIRNNMLTLILRIVPFYDGYVDRYTYTLSVIQNTSSTRFVNRLFYYTINTIIDVRGLKAIAIQKQKYDEEQEKIAANPRYLRSVYTSIYIKTIDIAYSY